jgi:hypothetical protein
VGGEDEGAEQGMRNEGLWGQGVFIVEFEHHLYGVFVESWVVGEMVQNVFHGDLEAGKGMLLAVTFLVDGPAPARTFPHNGRANT